LPIGAGVYLPRHFTQDDRTAIDDLIRTASLADLVSWTGSALEVSTIPLLLDRSVGPHGALLGHVARANPHWRSLSAAGSSVPGAATATAATTAATTAAALAIFRGPDAYVSPAWYVSKATDPRVVPTWNYLAVHVHGWVTVHDDPVWKESLVRRLTEAHEAGRPSPWSVDDAPPDFVARQLAAIVGLELRIERIEAKWKLSQNRRPEDASAVASVLASGSEREQAVAASMRVAQAVAAGPGAG
jgi:transcriptional regulator